MKRSFSSFSRLYNIKVTTLPNGLKVASKDAPGHFVSCGIYVHSGSRFESPLTLGCSHLIDRMAFKSTSKLSTDDIIKTLEHLGGNFMNQFSRESMYIQAGVFSKDLPVLVHTLCQMILHPQFNPKELDLVKQEVGYEIENRIHNMDETLPDLLHAQAFQGSLGTPLYNSLESLQRLDSNLLHEFHKTWFTPNRMVVAGVGMDHDMLCELVDKECSSLPSPSESLLNKQSQFDVSVQYQGGSRIVDSSGFDPHPNPEHVPMTHIQIAFEAPGVSDPDVYALAVYNQLMGGGGSFSAGGPGKGMYTRLYLTALNRYGWLESCHAVNHSYTDSNLFGITVSVPPVKEAHGQIIDIVSDQFIYMTQSVSTEELNRAKNQLKSNLLMSLESKIVEAEDIGKQILHLGSRIEVKEMCARIDALCIDDLKRVARRVILGSQEESPLRYGDSHFKPWKRTGNGQPTVLGYGSLGKNDDPLYKVQDTLKKWGLGKSQQSFKWLHSTK